LREATKAVRRALQSYGAALTRWERASGDFKSAVELDPSDNAAKQNADTVDRAIAKLVDSIREMQQAAAAMAQKKEELGEKMKQMKGRIPDQDMPPGAPGDEEEEEEQPMGQKPGDKEAQAKEGDQMNLPPELAGWLLDSFKLDNERRLPMGQQDTAEPKQRSRKPW
jgi:chromosome segregation ATPase